MSITYNNEKLKKSVALILEIPDNIDIEIKPEFPGSNESTAILINSERNLQKFIINKTPNEVTIEDILKLKEKIGNNIENAGFIPRHLSRLFGWWVIFSGSITLFAVCPVCGSAGCAGGFVFTGILAALLSIWKNFSSVFLLKIKSLFNRTSG